jgi:hypothetical protein
MSASAAEEPPEEFPDYQANPIRQEADHPETGLLAEEQPRTSEPAGTAWLLVGILVVVAVGVLMLLIFASGGNADASMML